MKSFTYLGSKINFDVPLEDEIVNTISKATFAFRKLYHDLWNERGISMKTQVHIYQPFRLGRI